MIRFEYEDGSYEYMYDAGDVAKYLKIVNPATKRIIGRNLFLELLRYNGVILKSSNQPSQSWILMGLARFHMVERRYRKYGMPLFSEKALGFIQNKLESGGWAVAFEKRRKSEVVKLDDIC